MSINKLIMLVKKLILFISKLFMLNNELNAKSCNYYFKHHCNVAKPIMLVDKSGMLIFFYFCSYFYRHIQVAFIN